MKTDNVLRCEAMELLMQTFGLVDAERFICMLKRDTFDYTEWRREQWNNMSIDEIHEAAAAYERN